MPKTPGSIELPADNSGTDLGNLANSSALRNRSTSRPSVNGLADRTNLEMRRPLQTPKNQRRNGAGQRDRRYHGREDTNGTWEAVGFATGISIGVLRAVTSKNGSLNSSIAT